jgi:hypothetical protein
LPIAEFAKNTLVHFDFCTADGVPIAMLTAEQNSRLSSALLLTLARLEASVLIDTVAERHIARLVRASLDADRELAWQRLFPADISTKEYRERWPALLTVADNLSRNFVVYVPVHRCSYSSGSFQSLTLGSK